MYHVCFACYYFSLLTFLLSGRLFLPDLENFVSLLLSSFPLFLNFSPSNVSDADTHTNSLRTSKTNCTVFSAKAVKELFHHHNIIGQLSDRGIMHSTRSHPASPQATSTRSLPVPGVIANATLPVRGTASCSGDERSVRVCACESVCVLNYTTLRNVSPGVQIRGVGEHSAT